MSAATGTGGAGELVASAASAAGKVILLGEHAVVHGQPALAAGLPIGVRVAVTPRDDPERQVAGPHEARVERALELAARLVGIPERVGIAVSIEGSLPIAVGLGSSAALSVALVRALAQSTGRALPDDEVAHCAHEVERIFHGTPSGVDSTVATHGGLVWFEAGPPPRREPVRAARAFDLLVVLSGTRHETARTVGGLRERAAAWPEVYGPVFAAIGSLVASGRRALETGDLERLGALMTMNHGLLRACGVSTPELDATVDLALAHGALGAKLTGGGGGGAVIALGGDGVLELAQALREAGCELIVAHLGAARREATPGVDAGRRDV